MICRKPVKWGDTLVQVLDFSLMKTHEVKKVITDLFNMEDIDDEVQHCLDLQAMHTYLKNIGA